MGLVVASLAAGVGTAAVMVLAIVPGPVVSTGWTSPLVLGLLVTMIVLISGAPMVMAGLVVGRIAVDAMNTQRRHRAVARGVVPLRQPSSELESRSRASKPLDHVEVARVTEDGAATRVIREYALDADPEALLAADTEQLAAIGYTLASVVRYPGKGGPGWDLLGLGSSILDLDGRFSWGTMFRRATGGRVVATFQLESRTHDPVVGDRSPAALGGLSSAAVADNVQGDRR